MIDKLKKYNIEPIRELTSDEIEYIATEVVKKIESMIVEFDGNYAYEKIKDSKMFIAKIPEQYTDVNYVVYTNAIYIREGRDIKLIDEILLHEIFHYIQCNQGEFTGGMPEQMGLCEFQEYKITGLAINETAIQLIISIVFDKKQEDGNYFGININAIHNKYFPVLCALLQQITYILGYKALLKSILRNTDDFKREFEKFAGYDAYDFLRNCFDKIMKARDNIAEDRRNMLSEKDEKKKKILNKKMNLYKKEIQDYFLVVQRLCYEEYFNPLFKKVTNKQEKEKLKEEIDKYHRHIGKIGEKDEFMIYIQKKMQKLNKHI